MPTVYESAPVLSGDVAPSDHCIPDIPLAQRLRRPRGDAYPPDQAASGALLVVAVLRAPDEQPLAPSITIRLLPVYRARLSLHLRDGDTLSRISANRLGVVCPGLSDWQPLSRLLARLHRAAGPPLPLPGKDGYATVSITAALVEDPAARLRRLRESAAT